MSKKLFLAAASVAALTIAGAATAGEISGTVGGIAFDDETPYKVASELNVTGTAKLSGALVAMVDLETDIVLASGQRDHLVTFEVTGATLTSPTLVAYEDAGTTETVGASTSLISNLNGKATFLLTVDADTVSHLALNGTIEQAAQADVTVKSEVKAVIGATEIPVDSAEAVTAVTYSPLMKAVSLAAGDVFSWEADLPDYTELDGSFTRTLARNFGVTNVGPFYKTLTGTTAAASDVLASAVLTVKGPAINEDILVTVDAYDAEEQTEANTLVFNLDATEAAGFAAGASVLAIDNDSEEGTFRLGTYKLTFAPTAKAGYTGPAASTVDAGKVTLEGTNFTAPWVSGTGAATSVIRISNSNATESGAVTVRLISGTKVVGGVATEYSSSAVLDAGTVPAGSDLQITSKQLTDAFGDFTRGDVQITINSDTDGFFAKMRNTRDGATFEQSLNHFDK